MLKPGQWLRVLVIGGGAWLFIIAAIGLGLLLLGEGPTLV